MEAPRSYVGSHTVTITQAEWEAKRDQDALHLETKRSFFYTIFTLII